MRAETRHALERALKSRSCPCARTVFQEGRSTADAEHGAKLEHAALEASGVSLLERMTNGGRATLLPFFARTRAQWERDIINTDRDMLTTTRAQTYIRGQERIKNARTLSEERPSSSSSSSVCETSRSDAEDSTASNPDAPILPLATAVALQRSELASASSSAPADDTHWVHRRRG